MIKQTKKYSLILSFALCASMLLGNTAFTKDASTELQVPQKLKNALMRQCGLSNAASLRNFCTENAELVAKIPAVLATICTYAAKGLKEQLDALPPSDHIKKAQESIKAHQTMLETASGDTPKPSKPYDHEKEREILLSALAEDFGDVLDLIVAFTLSLFDSKQEQVDPEIARIFSKENLVKILRQATHDAFAEYFSPDELGTLHIFAAEHPAIMKLKENSKYWDIIKTACSCIPSEFSALGDKLRDCLPS